MPSYPLLGPHVQAIFEYIKFEQEDIHLGDFNFNLIDFFGIPPGFNYIIDLITPFTENGEVIYSEEAYGLIYTCDTPCILTEIESTYNIGDLIAGPALVVNGSTKDNTTGYALLYNPFNDSLVFTRYNAQPLTNYGFILSKNLNIGLSLGETFKLKLIGTNIFEIYANGVLLDTVVDNGLSSIGTANLCKGIIEVRVSTTILPIPEDEEEIFLGHVTRRFWYCNDGISIVNPLLPTNPSDNYFLDAIDVFLKSGSAGVPCYGFYYAQAFTNIDGAGPSGRGYFQEIQFVYGGAISGSPISGICFRVDESKADPDDFTGYAVLVNESNGKIQLVYYLNESLSTLPPALQILAEVNSTLPAGTLVYVFLYQAADDIEANWEIDIWTKKPGDFFIQDIFYYGANQIPPGAQGADRQANSNYGLVWVGNTSLGNHIAEWAGLADDGSEELGNYFIIN